MSATPTPGPWLLKGPTGDRKRILIVANEDEWERLGVEVDSDDCDRDTALANARLIAASPDLLAALKRIVYWNNQERGISDEDWAIAREVIAKAEVTK